MYKPSLRNVRRLFPFALCFVLCPLLVAQQVGQADDPARGVTPVEGLFAYRGSLNIPAELGFEPAQSNSCCSLDGQPDSLEGLWTVPFKVPIKLIPVDPAAWANDATIGSTLTFRVLDDVIVRGGLFNRSSSYADAYAGTLIEAKVTRVRQHKTRTRHERAEPRVKEVKVGKSLKLELESSPRGGAQFSGIAKDLVVWSVKGPFFVVVYPPEMVLLAIFCGTTGCDL